MDISQVLADLDRLNGLIGADWVAEVGKEDERDRTLALSFAPAIKRLEEARASIEEVRDAAKASEEALGHQLGKWQRVVHGERLDMEVEKEDVTLQAMEEAMEKAMEEVRERLGKAKTPKEFADLTEETLEKMVEVPMWWINGKKKKQMPAERDTTHQDSRDVERDRVVLNGVDYLGSQYKYEGVISSLVKCIEEELGWARDSFPFDAVENTATSDQEKIFYSSLHRFARTVLCAGNRTHSGGNAYEAVMTLFGFSDTVLVTPDSEEAEPIRINLSRCQFKRYDASEKSAHTEYGLVAEVSAVTKYNLKDPERVEESLIGVSAEFQQTLAMGLPILQFDNPASQDNRHNAANIERFKAWEPEVYEDGVVILQKWQGSALPTTHTNI